MISIICAGIPAALYVGAVVLLGCDHRERLDLEIGYRRFSRNSGPLFVYAFQIVDWVFAVVPTVSKFSDRT